jgi:hypothetical protein
LTAGRTRLSPNAWFFAVPAIWIGHLSAGYTVASLRCHTGFLPGHALGMAAPRLAMLVLTFAALTALALVTLQALRSNPGPVDAESAENVPRFVGLLVAGACAVYLVWSVIVILTYATCPP